MLWHKNIGNVNGDNIVLIHGWCFNADIFTDFVEKNKKKYSITLIEIPGHGRSDEVDGNIDDWCREIIKLLPEKPTIIGSSLGGLLAIKIAEKIAIKNLILLGASPNFTNNKNWQYGIDKKIFIKFSQDLINNYEETLKRFVFLQTKNKKLIRNINYSINKYPPSKKALEQGLKILLENDLQQTFKSLDIKKYAVLGSLDTLVPQSIHNWYKKNNTKIKILNTGHLPFLEESFLLADIYNL